MSDIAFVIMLGGAAGRRLGDDIMVIDCHILIEDTVDETFVQVPTCVVLVGEIIADRGISRFDLPDVIVAVFNEFPTEESLAGPFVAGVVEIAVAVEDGVGTVFEFGAGEAGAASLTSKKNYLSLLVAGDRLSSQPEARWIPSDLLCGTTEKINRPLSYCLKCER